MRMCVWEGVRDGSRTAATSKVELFLIVVNGLQPLTIITKNSTLDVAAVLDPPLGSYYWTPKYKEHIIFTNTGLPA